MDEVKKTVTATDELGDEEVKDVAKVTTEPKPNDEDGKEKQVDYIKIRVDRAKKQQEKALLEDLGVEDVDTAKKLIKDGQTALEQVQALQRQLAQKEHQEELNLKRNALIALLDNEKVFDSEALVNYVDLDKVQFEDGKLADSETIISSLKKAKPNFFGKYKLAGDTYVKGQDTPPKTALDKQKEGNTLGAIDSYLKELLK